LSNKRSNTIAACADVHLENQERKEQQDAKDWLVIAKT
jgi:hypothetical protein